MSEPAEPKKQLEPVALAAPIQVVVQRWPVLERRTDEDGHIQRSADSYIRTKQPLESRTLTVERFLSPSRAEVYFGIGDNRAFSVRNGRCVGLADWVLEKDSQATLRKIAKELFPRAKRSKKKASAEPEGDDDEDVPEFADVPPANEVR